MEKVLISGGLGQLGYYAYNILKEQYKIFIIDNMSSAKAKPPADVDFIDGDICDSNIYEKLPKMDYIIHCAAQIDVIKSVNDPVYDAENNIIGTLNLLEYARKNDIKRFIHISSAATFGEPKFLPITEQHPREPISPYGLSKYTSERYAILYSQLYSLDVRIIIPFNIYSPLQHENDPYAGVIFKFIQAVKRGIAPTIFGDGSQTRDFVHALDVAKAVKLALEKEGLNGEVFNIASGKPISINDLAKIIIEESGNKDMEPIYKPPRPGEIKDSYASIDKAKKLLGYEPTISLREGIREMLSKV